MKQEKTAGRLKYFFDGRKEFIRRVQKTRAMDIKRLQVNDSWYIEGTICLVSEWIGAKGMVFQAWGARTGTIKLAMARYSGLHGGADFLHCWVANSIWLERAESLITKR